MGRERVEFFRESNSKPKEKIIVLAYEGNHTEAVYFEALKEEVRFNDEQIHLVSLRRDSNDTNSAPNHVFKKLKTEVKDKFNLDSNDELWMIIDRDKWQKIPEMFALCQNEGNFNLALSNPCFEIWILLHIKDLSEYSEVQLDDMFKNRKTGGKTYLKRLLHELLDGGYAEARPKPERYLHAVNLAIERAKALDNPEEDYPKTIGSHIYKLVEKVLK